MSKDVASAPLARATYRAPFNAVNPDLSQFKARGGKLIH